MTQSETSVAGPGHYLQINGLRMYYEVIGAGTPLLLIHGGTVTSQMWAPFIPSFAAHFQVIAPDSRGHGRTDNPTGGFSYRLMAEDMASLIQTLGLHKPLVFGYSDGGQIALEMGICYPGLAQAYVVGAAFYQFREDYLQLFRALGMEGPGVVNTEQTERANPDFVQSLREQHDPFHAPGYWKTLLTQISTMWLTPLDYTAEDFHKIIDPTLILVADHDTLAPVEQALAMYRMIHGAELAVIPGADHFSIAQQSDILVNIVLNFFQRHTISQQQ
jgi:pimeloyl-ACP methyl ester carboxylesterase